MKTSDAQECVTKVCTKCGEEKAVREFGIASSRKDGRQCHCKSCRSAYGKEKYAADNNARERAIKNASDWNKSHRERARISEKKYQEKIKLLKSLGDIQTLQMIKEKSKRYYINNKEKILTNNSYIKALLKLNCAPSNLIDAKLNQIKIHRAIKQLKKAIQERKEQCSNN